jgi:hypothetical protein
MVRSMPPIQTVMDHENLSGAQCPPAIISFMICRPVACNGPMPLPGQEPHAFVFVAARAGVR